MNILLDKLIREKYQTDADIKTEIINLSAILNLPKSTEAFVSDVHGEYAAFAHVMRSGAGNTRQKIKDLFDSELSENQQRRLAFLVYYPSERLAIIKKELAADQLNDWYWQIFDELIRLLKHCSTKYTRSKVRKTLASQFTYITEELIYRDEKMADKKEYYRQIVSNLIDLDEADNFIIATCHTIQELVVDHWHVMGDIYDRGPQPDAIIERLKKMKSVDVQWGNHDILWIGGAAGSALCIANLVRISARYANLDTIEDSYGINLRPLAMFAEKHYQPEAGFKPRVGADCEFTQSELEQLNKIQQAMAIIQFKLEGQTIDRRPEFQMEKRKLLDKISVDQSEIKINGHNYKLTNQCFQMIDFKNPYKLTNDEQKIMEKLVDSFTHSFKLHDHIDYLLKVGTIYSIYNDNLLVHGCVPVNSDGGFLGLKLGTHNYAGKDLFTMFESNLRYSYAHPEIHDDLATDLLWYLWTGPISPLFGKKIMATFERYFVVDKTTHVEQKNPYYELRHKDWFVDNVLYEFGVKKGGHIINGHTPVKKGHSPIMADGKMFVIDGGMSKPYQKTTGLGGYTLLSNSYGFQLVELEPFTTREKAIKNLIDIKSTKRAVDKVNKRQHVKDTDVGHKIKAQIRDLKNYLKQENLDLH